MQSTPGNGVSTTSSGGGGGGRSRGGLARFRSAPATWLEALLEEDEGDEEEDDPLKQNQCFTQLLTGNTLRGNTNNNTTNNNNNNTSHGRSFSISYEGGGGVSGGVPGSGFLRQNSSPGDFLGSSEYGGGKRARELDESPFPGKYAYQVKGEQSGHVPGGGVSGLMDLDKLFEDSTPCKFRAKRGCATHPRSIAERVRRTRISDRIRKLQELMPNMDKQTNTADMLDEAVEYVKYLQKQIQELSEQQRNCKCKARECT